MKKILVLLSFIAFFFSCTKESCTPEKNEVLVSFAFNPISETGNIQTKSFLDEIIPNLVYKTPTKVYLRGPQNYILDLSSKTTYSIQPGQYTVFSEILSSSSAYRMESSTSVSDCIQLRIKHEGWINIYSRTGDAHASRRIYDTEEEALKCASVERVDTIKIEWEE